MEAAGNLELSNTEKNYLVVLFYDPNFWNCNKIYIKHTVLTNFRVQLSGINTARCAIISTTHLYNLISLSLTPGNHLCTSYLNYSDCSSTY